MNPQILTVVTGVSGVFGLMGLMVYLYYQLQITRAERSVREVVEGEGLFNADQVVEILKQFSDDEARLQALKALTQHDGTKAKNILTKVNNNVDIERLTSISSRNYRNISRSTAAIFSFFAVVGLSYYQFAPLQSDVNNHIIVNNSTSNAYNNNNISPTGNSSITTNTNINTTPSYVPKQFDGRVGKVFVKNTSLYEFKVTLWHPDSVSIFDSWVIPGTSKLYLKKNGQAFSVGNDWGIQIGESSVKSIGDASVWQGNEWRISQDSFFDTTGNH